ncbi:MAG: IS1634 family transposase [Thermoplasmata archaeon]|nr:IS1634 family transposase [Thermoplasmata archaeon]NIY05254.1 IS1634 family transposase [Thermoplasmata archaeon]
MFVRVKRAGGHEYLQLVENRWERGRTRQRVLATLGRLDRLQARGQVDVLLRSLGRFAQAVQVQETYARGDLEALSVRRIGPGLAFGRLWEKLEIEQVLRELLRGRRFSFDVERAIFATVVHRLFESGSDRQGLRFLRDVDVPGTAGLELHHLYRAMRWLGETKEEVEELLFSAHRDLFTQLELVFFDTTSFYFEGEGGESLGQYGHSKEHRPDRRQVVVGALLTEGGRPISCEVVPGNRTDAKALLPVVDRARERFGLNKVCFVADRGMVSDRVIQGLEERGMGYILGVRLRQVKEVRDEVLSRPGRYREVAENLQVKEVGVLDRRYILCYNPEQAVQDAADREAILEGLEERLRQGPKVLVGNRGFRRYLLVEKGAVRIDPKKVTREARFDGKWALRTNTDLPASEVASQYKRLLLVEQFFRAAKSLLETRPIFHKFDATIIGHLFCSFLALLLTHELGERLRKRGDRLEWADILRDLEALEEVEVRHQGKHYLLRTPLQGVCGKVLQAAGVAIPPPVRETVGHGAKPS